MKRKITVEVDREDLRRLRDAAKQAPVPRAMWGFVERVHQAWHEARA